MHYWTPKFKFITFYDVTHTLKRIRTPVIDCSYCTGCSEIKIAKKKYLFYRADNIAVKDRNQLYYKCLNRTVIY